MCAVIAFGRSMCIGIDVQSIVGTSLHTGLATNATTVVEIDDSIRTLVERSHRAYRDTGCVVAMVAPHHRKQPARIRILPFLDIFHPGSVDTHRNLMLTFAGNRTGVTADTTSIVNNKTVIGHAVCSFRVGQWVGIKQAAY